MPRRDTKFHVLPNVPPEDVYYVSIWAMHYTCMIVCPLESRGIQTINIGLKIITGLVPCDCVEVGTGSGGAHQHEHDHCLAGLLKGMVGTFD